MRGFSFIIGLLMIATSFVLANSVPAVAGLKQYPEIQSDQASAARGRDIAVTREGRQTPRTPRVKVTKKGLNRSAQTTGECPKNYTLFVSNTGAKKCIDLKNDDKSCGSLNNVCPTAYNGKGTPICNSGFCSVSCPPGLVARSTASGYSFCN